uniref:Uncharacterized protein n=1 Tax=Rhizophora mucronata TaxID=61149 RepID=A0A2P2NKI3_RHIMU
MNQSVQQHLSGLSASESHLAIAAAIF